MRKIILILAIAALLFLIYQAFIPKFRFRYYTSNDKSQILTRVDYPNTWFDLNETYFTPGHYDENKIPDVYIKPNYSSDWDWVAHVTFHSKGILIQTDAEVKNTTDQFCYAKDYFYSPIEMEPIDSLRKTFHSSQDTTLYWSDK